MEKWETATLSPRFQNSTSTQKIPTELLVKPTTCTCYTSVFGQITHKEKQPDEL